jgi:hypothetical protein
VEQRTANLLRSGTYGAYVEDGDPYGWAPGAIVTVYLEPHGDEGDCVIPFDYYGNGFDVCAKASDLLKTAFLEFVNAAVVAVWRC